MDKKEIDEKLLKMMKLAKDLSDVSNIPVVKYRAEMVLGLLKELEVTVIDN